MQRTLTSNAVVMNAPGVIDYRAVELSPPTENDLIVQVSSSGISTGTEKLLWKGTMPAFPGLKYPLVPGYEAVGTVVQSGNSNTFSVGDRVFVPGSTGFKGDVRGLFGASAGQLVVPAERVHPVGELADQEAVLLALAATAMHIMTHQLRCRDTNMELTPAQLLSSAPDLIVGHGTLGRLLARLCVAIGADAPTVWEKNTARISGATQYKVTSQVDDDRRDYRRICDVSGAGGELFDALILRLARGGHLILGGFYANRVGFSFPPAFMRETSLSIAAEWVPDDLALVQTLIDSGALSLQGLVTHTELSEKAKNAYAIAFDDPECLKMVLDWTRT